MFSFLSRNKNAPPGSPGQQHGGQAGGDPQPEEDPVAELKREFDRRLEALSLCLDEKSQENTQLDLLLKEREEGEKALRTRIATLEVDLEAERDVVREYQRRLEAMTRVLEDSILTQNNSGVGSLPQFSDIENEKFLTDEEVAERKKKKKTDAEAMDKLPPGHFAGQSTSSSSSSAASGSKKAADAKAKAAVADVSGKPKKSKEKSKDKDSSKEDESGSGSGSKPIKRAEKVGAKKSGDGEEDGDADKSETLTTDPLKVTEQEAREPIKALQDAKQQIFKLKKVS